MRGPRASEAGEESGGIHTQLYIKFSCVPEERAYGCRGNECVIIVLQNMISSYEVPTSR